MSIGEPYEIRRFSAQLKHTIIYYYVTFTYDFSIWENNVSSYVIYLFIIDYVFALR